MRRWLHQLPNLISSLRILLVAPIALCLTDHRLVATLCLFGVAAFSDAADGFLARRFGWQTELGGALDPIADKLMLATVFVVLAVQRHVPVWLSVAVIARDVVVVLGAISYRTWIGPVTASPSVISKLNTLCQIMLILAVISELQFAWPPAWAVLALGAMVLALAVLSGIDYVLVYGRRAAVNAA